MGGIGSIFTGPGAIAERLCDMILPSELEWVGDAASFYANVQSGNFLAAAMDLVDFYENVKNGDLKAATMYEGLRKMLPPEWQAFLDKLVQPDAPPTCEPQRELASAGATTGGSAGASTASSSSGAATASSSSGTDKAGRSAPPKSVADIHQMSDDAVLRMVREGKIPEDLKKDQGAMMAIQQRLNDIQQMNALITNMIRALHEMQMEIIRNIRA